MTHPILKRVRIQSFKSIVDQELELGQLNVFIGQNGSGKSNLLEAVGMLSAAVTGEINYSRLAERGMRLSSPEIFRSAFKNRRRRITFMLEGDFDRFLYRGNISSIPEGKRQYTWGYHAEKLRRGKTLQEKIAGRSNRIIGIANVSGFRKESLKRDQGLVPAVHALGKFTEYEEDAINSLKEFAIFSPSSPILRGVANDESHRRPLGLFGGGMTKALSDLLRTKKYDELLHFFDLLDWFQSVGTRQPSKSLISSQVHTGTRVVAFRDKYMSANFNQLLAYDVSEGALYVLFTLLLLAHPDAPNIFALDNVDNALNPSLVTRMITHTAEVLENHPEKQVFMTTHNPATLDGLDLFNSNYRLFVVKRGKAGDTVFERIKPPKNFTKEQWQEKFGFMKLSDLWLSGVIEGLSAPEGF